MSSDTLLQALPVGDLLAMYRTMFLIVECERYIQNGLASGHLQFQYYPVRGQEAIPAALVPLLRCDDFMVTTYRGVHDSIAKGMPIREIFAEVSGLVAGTSKGKGGPMHLADPRSGAMVTTGIVGGGLPIANGLALASQLKGTASVTIVNFGDGATSIGAFGESLNLASLWKLPVVFMCQNNGYAEYTSYAGYTASPALSDRALGYALPGVRVDGTDPVAVHAVAREAVERARSGLGPTLIEAVCHRLQGHSFGSDESHMDQEALAVARCRLPTPQFRQRLLAAGKCNGAQLNAVEEEVRREVAVAAEVASAAPEAAELYVDIYDKPEVNPDLALKAWRTAPRPIGPPTPAATRRLTFCQALNDAMELALAAHPSVFILGEDVADPAGGIMKATKGLSTRFGAERVRATPIAEEAIVGAAVGAALAGMRPIAEIMIEDFLAVAMDQVANHAAKLRYMSGGRTSVPLTLRTMMAGATGSFGAQHSQSLEAWFTHIPGLKVVAPSTPADAKGLLLSCIFDADPCIFIEPVKCYFDRGPVPVGDWRVPLGLAEVRRKGRDLTLVTYSYLVNEALAAATLLAEEGIDVEVLDLRSLLPLDLPTLFESVGRTRRALVAHSAVTFGGFGAEIASLLHSELHRELVAPVVRVGAAFTPVPFAKTLESLHFPDARRLAAAARQLMSS